MAGRPSKVTLKNVSGGSASVIIDNRLKQFPFPDMTVEVTKKELLDLYNHRGGRVMLQEDIIRVMEADARELIGLDPIDEYMLDGEGFKELFTKNEEKIEDFLTYCSDSMLERAVDEAIAQKISNTRIMSIIEEFSGKKLGAVLDEKLDAEKKVAKQTTKKSAEKVTEAGTKKTARKPKAQTQVSK